MGIPIRGLKVKRKKLQGLRDCDTSANAVIPTVEITPLHAHLAVPGIPVHVRHAAIRKAGARAERPVLLVQMLTRLLEELEFMDETFGQSLGRDVLRL